MKSINLGGILITMVSDNTLFHAHFISKYSKIFIWITIQLDPTDSKCRIQNVNMILNGFHFPIIPPVR